MKPRKNLPTAAQPVGGPKRATRVAESLRHEIADILLRDLGDPRLSTAVVTRIALSDDLQIAQVAVRLTGDDSPDARRRLIAGFRAAAGAIRRALGPRLALRRTPELRFTYDDGVDKESRVSELLAEIARDDAEKPRD